MLHLVNLLLSFTALLNLSRTADILFAGDAMQHEAQIKAAKCADGSYDYARCFADLAPLIEAADLAVVNLETPLGGKPYRGYPCFSAPDSYAEALRDAGFDLMLTANNHTLDCRDRGLRRTIAALDSLGIPHTGTYIDSDARERLTPLIVDVNRFRIAFLNYTYGTNGITVQGDVVVDYIDRDAIAADIERARRRGAEIICVAVHWGDEYQLLPNGAQRQLAQWLIDNDVDIIFGGHPHVIQPMKMVTNTATGHRTALIYSLGNFISNMKTRDTRGGALAHVTLRRDSLGNAYVDAMSYSLIFTDIPSAQTPQFIVREAADSLSPAMVQHRDEFVRAARDIFDKHNVDVAPRK